MKKALYSLLLTAIILFCLDRSIAYLYKPKPGATEIILYSTDWCPYCNSLRTHFDSSSIPYTEHDVEKSISGIAGFWALRARGVPVTVIGPKVVYGYDLDTINQSLIKLGHGQVLID